MADEEEHDEPPATKATLPPVARKFPAPTKPAPEGPYKTMNPFHFPVRGLARPTLSQVMSEPNLRTEYLALEERPEKKQYREDWLDMLHHLDDQCAQRNLDHKRTLETEIALERMRAAYKRTQASEGLVFQRPEWTYTDPPNYFEKPRPGTLQEPSNQFHKNSFLQGMYDNPEYKPPHAEYNVHGGWSPHSRNLRNESLALFREKPPFQRSPKEEMYAKRLERKLAKAKELEKQDALNKTCGYLRKQRIEAEADDVSCLKRTKPAWQEQQVTTHEIFMPTEVYKPGDHIYETGLPEHIQQAERALSFKRNVIAGDGERKSFWIEPKAGALKGSTVRATRAKVLLCPPGCHELKAQVLKESQSLSALTYGLKRAAMLSQSETKTKKKSVLPTPSW